MTLVAIDGPAGSGKSTVARALAERLGFRHVDTGAFYRAATLAVLRAGADPADAEACTEIVRRSEIVVESGRALLDGEDVSGTIRGAEVTAAVSQVSAHPQVRELLINLQRAHAAAGDAVVEGRDAGTAVVPDATLKIWLTATPRVRAERRAAQVGADGAAAVAAHALDLARRDRLDSERLVPAPDAVRVDNSGRDLDAVVEQVCRLLETREARAPGGSADAR